MGIYFLFIFFPTKVAEGLFCLLLSYANDVRLQRINKQQNCSGGLMGTA